MAKKPCLADMLADDDDRGSAQFKGAKQTKAKDPVGEKKGKQAAPGQKNFKGGKGK